MGLHGTESRRTTCQETTCQETTFHEGEGSAMSETLVTVVGNVATQPVLKNTASGVPMTRFRLATTERRWDRAEDRWTDGHTSFFTVWAAPNTPV